MNDQHVDPYPVMSLKEALEIARTPIGAHNRTSRAFERLDAELVKSMEEVERLKAEQGYDRTAAIVASLEARFADTLSTAIDLANEARRAEVKKLLGMIETLRSEKAKLKEDYDSLASLGREALKDVDELVLAHATLFWYGNQLRDAVNECIKECHCMDGLVHGEPCHWCGSMDDHANEWPNDKMKYLEKP